MLVKSRTPAGILIAGWRSSQVLLFKAEIGPVYRLLGMIRMLELTLAALVARLGRVRERIEVEAAFGS